MILDILLNRHFPSLEDPAVPVTGQNLDAYQLVRGGSLTSAGEVITVDNALELSPVWCAVYVISSAVAKLPINVMEKLEPSGAQTSRLHFAHQVWKKPNPLMTPYIYKQLIMFQVLLYGNHLSLIIRDNTGRPIELLPLLPQSVEVWTSESGEYWYTATLGTQKHNIPAVDVLHVKQMGFDGVLGLSTVSKARNAIGLGLALNNYALQFFKNDARPSVALKHPGHLSEEAQSRLRKSWNDLHGGDNKGGVAILEEGLDLATFGITPQDGQAIESLKMNIEDVARFFNIQPNKIHHLERMTFNNVSEANQAFLDDTIDPWLTCIEEECNTKLLSDYDRRTGSRYFDFDVTKLLRMNPLEQAERAKIEVEGGWKSVNDIREEQNLSAVDGGEQYFRPLNFTQLDTPPEPPAQIENNAARDNLMDALGRAAGRLADKATKAARDPKKFMDWLDGGFRIDNEDALLRVLKHPVRLVNGDENAILDAIFDSLRVDLLELAGRSTADDLYSAMDRLGKSWLKTKPTLWTEDFLRGETNGHANEIDGSGS